jgi:hypothetical protein
MMPTPGGARHASKPNRNYQYGNRVLSEIGSRRMGSKPHERRNAGRLISAGLMAVAVTACTARNRGSVGVSDTTKGADPAAQAKSDPVKVTSDALGERLRRMIAAAQSDKAR